MAEVVSVHLQATLENRCANYVGAYDGFAGDVPW